MIDDGVVRGAQPSRADLDDLVALFANPRVGKTLGGVKSPAATLATLHRWQELWSAGRAGPLIFRLCPTNRFIGYAGLAPADHVEQGAHELLYGLVPEFWRQGFATRLARLVLTELGSHPGVGQIIGFTLASNQASRRVLEKVGLAYEREFQHAELPHVLYRFPRGSSAA